LESTRRVDTIVLDKTGTVTTGQMDVVAVAVADGCDEADALAIVAALERGSEHPIARAIVRAAGSTSDVAVTDFTSRGGLGVSASIDGAPALVGRPSFIIEQAGPLPARLAQVAAEQEALGRTVVVGAWGGAPRLVVAVADTVKATSSEAIVALHALGLRTMLLTGDNWATASAVAADVGIAASDVVADVLPAGKVGAVRRLQESGAVVAMVGDGVNDAAALAQADLGIAMGTGTDVAIEASDLTLVGGDLRGAVDALRLSRRTLATIKANVFWAFAYNVAALPLAAAGVLNPVIASMAMAGSSVFVLTNSLRLRRFR
jgi:Cu+-exporting ATPase